MTSEFVDYEIALELKNLGFNGECLAKYCRYNPTTEIRLFPNSQEFLKGYFNSCRNLYYNEKEETAAAPLWQQSIDWIRSESGYNVIIMQKMIPSNEIKYYVFKNRYNKDWSNLFDSYEEARRHAILDWISKIKKSKTE